uniref:Uncharacterized protein n=1 Tax=Mastacembelus armatus TaxID=205130 RepID=A0A3Q3M5Q5_9TELE
TSMLLPLQANRVLGLSCQMCPGLSSEAATQGPVNWPSATSACCKLIAPLKTQRPHYSAEKEKQQRDLKGSLIFAQGFHLLPYTVHVPLYKYRHIAVPQRAIE